MEQKVLTSGIAATYRGCGIVVKGWGRDEADSPEMKMTVLSDQSICIGKNKNGIDMWVKTSTCQLILKPLSSISDADAVEVAKIIYQKEPSVDQLNASKGVVDSFTFPHIDLPVELSARDGQRITDFLREKGYDCGYGDIPSLIDAGIAISAPNDERSVATMLNQGKES